MRKLPPASDPIWADDNYRTSTFLGLCDLHGLDAEAAAKITGQTASCIYAWRHAKHRVIPAANLRALMYDLMPDNA